MVSDKGKTIPASSSRSTSPSSDGAQAYIGPARAGVIDVRRHELLKKIPIGEVPAIAKLIEKCWARSRHQHASPSIDGRFLYGGRRLIVGVIDTREDKVVKTIRWADPWRIYMNHDGSTPTRTTETRRSRSSSGRTVAATLEAGPI